MFDSLKTTNQLSYLSFLLFLVYSTVLKNVKNFRESYVFHCLVIKVVCLATACLLYHICFSLSSTFLSFFKLLQHLFFSTAFRVYHNSFALSRTFLISFHSKMNCIKKFSRIVCVSLFSYQGCSAVSSLRQLIQIITFGRTCQELFFKSFSKCFPKDFVAVIFLICSSDLITLP